MEKFKISECETLNIPAGNDVALLVKLVKGFESAQENALDTVAEPFPVELSENVQVAVVSERGFSKALDFTVGDGGQLLFTLLAIDVRAGLRYGIDVRGTLNDTAWHAYCKSVVKVTAATERGPQQVALAADPYEITMEVGYVGDVVPRHLRDLEGYAALTQLLDAMGETLGKKADAEDVDASIRQLGAMDVKWSELKQMRDSGLLTAGRQYRITDYVTKALGHDGDDSFGRSWEHPFDLIVTATTNASLSEVARAVLHDGDTYFAGSNLAAWQLKYCLDNDRDTYNWADEVNGKGVIYWMRDEWGNEFPFDFKNIKMMTGFQARSWSFNAKDASLPMAELYNGYVFNRYTPTNDGSTPADENFSDASLVPFLTRGNVVKQSAMANPQSSEQKIKYRLPGVTFMLPKRVVQSGTGTVGNRVGADVYDGIFFVGECENNVFGPRCQNTLIMNSSNNTFGAKCMENAVYGNSDGNVFGTECMDIVLVGTSRFNTFESCCEVIKLADGCAHNSFIGYNAEIELHGCYSNVFMNVEGGEFEQGTNSKVFVAGREL